MSKCREFMKWRSKETVDKLTNPTNTSYIAAQAYPAVVMPILVDALALKSTSNVAIECKHKKRGHTKEFVACCVECLDDDPDLFFGTSALKKYKQ